MNLYHISQNECTGWDTYDSCIVCAENEEEARNMKPIDDLVFNYDVSQWALHPKNVNVILIGTARLGLEKGVVLASFNAG